MRLVETPLDLNTDLMNTQDDEKKVITTENSYRWVIRNWEAGEGEKSPRQRGQLLQTGTPEHKNILQVRIVSHMTGQIHLCPTLIFSVN